MNLQENIMKSICNSENNLCIRDTGIPKYQEDKDIVFMKYRIFLSLSSIRQCRNKV